MQATATLEILVHRKTHCVLIARFIKKKRGTLEAWFAHGKLYRYTNEEIKQSGLVIINNIIKESQDDYKFDKSEFDLMTNSETKQYKIVSVGIYPDEIRISPYGKSNRYGSAIGKYTIKFKLDVDNNAFGEQLEKAIGDAE